MQEHQKDRQDVMYVYDRICSKNVKSREILREYGKCVSDADTANPERPFGKAFAESQRARAEEYMRTNPKRQSAQGGANQRTRAGSEQRTNSTTIGYTYTDESGNEYIYRPGKAYGGAQVKQKPLKLILDHIINMFESIEARGKRDEETAKRQAIARKKFAENRHALLTAFIMLIVTAVFVSFVYLAFFVISDVEVSGSAIYTDSEVLASVGFEIGDNLYSFHAGQAEEAITFFCPYIKSAHISRTVPNSVSIAIEDDAARYYADIYGDVVELSAGLRVLSVTTEETAKSAGLIKLVLPAVKYSVCGRVAVFADERDLRYIRSIISTAEESLLGTDGRITKIDLSDEHNITINCDSRYILRIGAEKDCDLKLRMAYKTINDESFDREVPANIDVSKIGEASVRYDMRLVVE